MGNSIHPLDTATEELRDVRQEVLQTFLADGQIDGHERAALDALAAVHTNIVAYRRREIFADSYKRNGDSHHTRALCKAAGNKITSLDSRRTSSSGVPANVVQFRRRDDRNAS